MARLSHVALIALGMTKGAQAWGALGHATVAYVAQHYVSPEAASWAQGILDSSSGSYLASIASWADEYRLTSAGKWSASLHFIDAEDNPPSDCNVDYERDCGSSGCSISAIANYTQRVSDKSLSSANHAEALKFLVHFIGDMTQPLHDEAYAVGGNEINVTFDGYQDNLHSDWDTYMPQKLIGGHVLSDAESWAKTLVQNIESGNYTAQATGWIKGDNISDPITTATRWASDANALVCSVVMPNGAAALQTGDLYPTYYDSVIDTIELQIAKGGYRLANWINKIYSFEIAKRDHGAFHDHSLASSKRDISGRSFLPKARPVSRAQLARAAMDGDCCNSNRHNH